MGVPRPDDRAYKLDIWANDRTRYIRTEYFFTMEELTKQAWALAANGYFVQFDGNQYVVTEVAK